MGLLKNAADFFRKILTPHPHPAASDSLKGIQRAIAYRFRDPRLLETALTHKSSLLPGNRKGLESNERMEFLGDAVINCCVTEHLYLRYPDKSEGHLTKIKSLIVSRKILGEIGFSIGLETFVRLGPGEKDAVGRSRHTIVSNAFESVVGAMYLDSKGLTCVKNLLDRHLFPRIDEFLSEKSNINYKSRILELSQRDGFGIPRYSVVATTGPEHDKVFRVQIQIAGVTMGEGFGANKKTAEQDAAKNALYLYDKSTIEEHTSPAAGRAASPEPSNATSDGDANAAE
jgi:ribonuclease-3